MRTDSTEASLRELDLQHATAPVDRLDESRRIPVLRRAIGPWRFTLERRCPTGSQLSSRYSRVARSWSARMRALGFQTAYRTLLRRLIAEGTLGLSSAPLRVLDAGIGGGDLSLALLKEVEGPIRLDGIDLCPEMLEAAAGALREAGAEFRLQRGDVNELPYSDDRFDLVLLGHVLEHLSNPSGALREVRRVLKPGARLLLVATRETIAGTAIQMRWGTHCFDETKLARVLREGGAKEWRLIPLPAPPWCRWLSRACVAAF